MIGDWQAETRPAFDGARVGTLHPLVRQYVVGRLNRKEIVNGSGRTQKMVLGQFADVFGRRPVANMSRHDVQRYQETIAHLSIGTRRNRPSVSRSFVRWLQLDCLLRNSVAISETALDLLFHEVYCRLDTHRIGRST